MNSNEQSQKETHHKTFFRSARLAASRSVIASAIYDMSTSSNIRRVTFTLAITLPFGTAHALTDYEGRVAYGLGGDVVTAGATTHVPASYWVGAGNDWAESMTHSMAGGTVSAKATSELVIAAAKARLEYRAHLAGPAGPAVPVRVIASGYADGSGIYGISSAFFALNALTPLFGYVSHSYGQPRQSFVIDSVIMLAPNTDFIVSLMALASSGNPYEPALSFAEAFVDPQFIVDSAFASMYTVVGLPVTPVPEADTWAMLLAGLGLVAAAVRRRH